MANPVGEAWQEIATRTAPLLPGNWVVRRRGARTTLIREPIEWTVPWIGFGPSRSSDWGYLYAAVVPLVRPFNWLVTYGLAMGDQRGDPDIPPSLHVLEPGAFDVVQRFLQRQGLPAVDRWPAERFADVAERSYQLPADRRDHPVAHWLLAAGWRVVTGSGSPVEPARDAIAYFQQRDATEDVGWYRGLLAAWESGGRAAALEFLVEYRQQVLTREQLVG
jgi:hypothetical protein